VPLRRIDQGPESAKGLGTVVLKYWESNPRKYPPRYKTRGRHRLGLPTDTSPARCTAYRREERRLQGAIANITRPADPKSRASARYDEPDPTVGP
jgi:hypothetical protein